jgi:anti-anti-sigma regulatory factor
MNTNPTDFLEGAAQGAQLWVRVIGRGNFKLGPTLKAYAVSAIQRGCRRLLVDLQNCIALDSTFMGVLAGLALHLKTVDGVVVVVRPGASQRDALTTLGLDRLLQLPADAPPAPTLQRLDLTPDVANAAANILAAHEHLIAAAPENRPRFSELVTQLKNEINRP